MKWVKRKLDAVMSFLLKMLFGKNTSLGKKYGVSFDSKLVISSLPSPMPNLHDFYELVVTEKLIYEVMKSDPFNNLVYIREVGSDSIYPIHAELFIMLFVKNNTSFDIKTLK